MAVLLPPLNPVRKKGRIPSSEREERCRHHTGDVQSLKSTGSATPGQGWESNCFNVTAGVITMAQTGGPLLLHQTDPERGLLLFFLGGCSHGFYWEWLSIRELGYTCEVTY